MLWTVSNCILFSLYTPECLPIPFGLSHDLVRRIQVITASKLQHSTFNSLSETPVNLYLQQVQVMGHACLCSVFLRVGWVGWVLYRTDTIHLVCAFQASGSLYAYTTTKPDIQNIYLTINRNLLYSP